MAKSLWEASLTNSKELPLEYFITTGTQRQTLRMSLYSPDRNANSFIRSSLMSFAQMGTAVSGEREKQQSK